MPMKNNLKRKLSAQIIPPITLRIALNLTTDGFVVKQ